MRIPVYVFEDRSLKDQEYFDRLLIMPYTKEVREELVLSFEWHPVWNHLGETSAQNLNIRSTQITTLETFDEALTCVARENIANSILFFDMHLAEGSLPLDLVRCASVRELLRGLEDQFLKFCRGFEGSSVETLEDALDALSTNRQGLLLVWMLIANCNAKHCDIWVGSSATELNNIMPVLNTLAESSQRNLRIFDAGGSVARDGAQKTSRRFLQSFDKFSELYASIEGRLWPDSGSESWFAVGGSAEVPHRYEDLQGNDRKSAYRTIIGNYVRSLTGRSSIPETWFRDKGMHETLKRLVGGCAVGQRDGGQRYHPSLGSIILLIAAAEKDEDCVPAAEEDWFLKTDFHMAALAAILPGDFNSRQTRLALLALYSFLRYIVSSARSSHSSISPEKSTNVIACRWDLREPILHLVLELKIDCLRPEPGKSVSLLQKVFNRPWYSRYGGDTTEAYQAFRDAFNHDDGTRLALTIYPNSEGSEAKTVLDFNVPV